MNKNSNYQVNSKFNMIINYFKFILKKINYQVNLV